MRKLYHHLKDVCSGIGERDIRAVLGKSPLHQWLNVRFQNKAALKIVSATTVQIHNQLDLVSMESMPVKWKGKGFKYVLSLVDVFGRYHWLTLVERKKWSNRSSTIENLQRAWASSCPSARPGARI